MSLVSVYSSVAPRVGVVSCGLLAGLTTCFWAMVSLVLQQVFQRWNKTYQVKSSRDRIVYVSYVNSLLHAPIACINSLLCTYYVW